jgi:hypothetical protein
MEVAIVKDARTKEIVSRKISLSRVENEAAEPKGSLVGWEYSTPKQGERYTVYLGKGRILRTSPVKEIRESDSVIWVTTSNSLYRVEYLD